jgi:hypothetical protein
MIPLAASNLMKQAITLRTPWAFQKRPGRDARNSLILRYRDCPTSGFQNYLFLERRPKSLGLVSGAAFGG